MNNTDVVGRNENGWTKLFTLMLFLPLLAVSTTLDNDIWFILNSGRYVMANGIPHIEPFSMHENLSFVMQQWLTDVIYWNVYRFLGSAGLIALICVLSALTVWLIYKTCMLVSDNNFIVSFSVSLILSCVLSLCITTRPQMLSMLIFALEIYCTENYIRKKKIKYILMLPVLSLLLINLHASMWLMFFVIALPFIVDSFKFKLWIFSGEGFKKLPYLASLAVSVIMGFVNPYGIDAMTYLFRSYGYEEISTVVDEMAPPDLSETTGVIFFAIVALILVVLFLNRNERVKLRYLLLGLGTYVLAMTAYRNLFIFIVGVSSVLAFSLKHLKPESKPETEKTPEEIKSTKRLRVVLIAAICVCLAVAIGVKVNKIITEEADAPSKGAVDYILDNNVAGDVVLYTGYNDGDYSEFRGIRSYIDARAEVFLDSNNGQFNYMKEYVDMQLGKTPYNEVLDKYDFTHIYAAKGDILSTYLPYDSGYEKVYEDKYGSVYIPIK